MPFMDKVKGHKAAKEALLNGIAENKVGHAYIFEGKKGVGKMTLAKAFASRVTNPKIQAESNPDIIIVTNKRYDVDKKTFSIDTVRLMRNDVYIRPYFDGRKVFIIPEADNMGIEAQNGLLKVFEEPPEYCTIILLAENANMLLDTIRSRAVKIRLLPLDENDVKEYLINCGTDKGKAEIAAIMSKGSIGKALTFVNSDEDIALREKTLGYIFGLVGNRKSIYDFSAFLKQNKESIDVIEDILSDLTSDVLRLKTDSDYNPINADKCDELKSFCKTITKKQALRLCEISSKYATYISANTNYKFAVQCMAMEYWEEIHGRSYRSAL